MTRESLADATLAAARAPHVEVSVEGFGGSVELTSCSGALEAVWLRVRDEQGQQVHWDGAALRHLPAAVALTPRDARALARVLLIYADTHRETGG